jgi:SAM-dependent methyltransferase
MFEQSAALYDAYYGFLDYVTAAAELRALIRQLHPGATSLLDVACGTGKYLEHLRGDYRVEGLDLLPGFLEIARQRCPGVPFHQGDMADFRLGHRFDVVTCLFCSIGHMKTVEDVERAVACMARHLESRGLLIVEPWISPEKCWTNRVTADFTDLPDLKIVRMYTHEIEGRASVFDINYLVGTPQGVRHFTEREELGLFTHEEYTRAFEKAGLAVAHHDRGLFPKHNYGLYVGSLTARP